MDALQHVFGARVKTGVPLAKYTSARIGGPADVFLIVNSSQELAQAAQILWQSQAPFIVLGGGSNVLVSDAGVRGAVLLNRARKVRFASGDNTASVTCESGASLGLVARQAAARGLSGLEWAAGIPGTVGGAVFGNAGAHGGDMAGNLMLADILHPDGQQQSWDAARLQFAYRSSILKENPVEQVIVLSAQLRLQPKPEPEIQAQMDRFVEHRRKTQPPGASMGSMFKNPSGDYAGRLVDAAGLKGKRIGDAQISTLHGNFFLNLGNANARQVYDLIQHARQAVQEQFGITLQLEIELLGEW